MKKTTTKNLNILKLVFAAILIQIACQKSFAQYCAAGSTDNGCVSGNEYIDNVTFNTINNSTACEAGSYADFTGISTSVYAGNTYSISINNPNTFTGDAFVVWIDYDHNNIFDSNEQTILSGAFPATGTITIPANAATGATTMRARVIYSGSNPLDACGIFNFGETEDYTVNILANYCPVASLASCSLNKYISSVDFNTIHNNSTCETGGYADYSNQSTLIFTGQSYVATITHTNNTPTDSVAVWIDFNHNTSFTDPGEMFNLSIGTTGSVVIPIPLTATTGTTRMRVQMSYTTISHLNPCDTIAYGETEDYLVNIQVPVLCSGTPAQSNAVVDLDSVCVPTLFNLSLQNQPSENSITYQWQLSPDSITWTDISGAIFANTTTTQHNATWYRCNTTCSTSGLNTYSTPVKVFMNTYDNCYCVNPVYYGGNGYASNLYISNFTFAGINNNSGCDTVAPFYTRYDNIIGTAQQNLSYPISISCPATPHVPMRFRIYIDYNDNGSFDDPGEYIYNSQNIGLVTNLSSGRSYTIPANAPVGIHALRVRCTNTGYANNIYPNSCSDDGSRGEVEDYFINITAAPLCSALPNPGNTVASLNSACGGRKFYLSLQNSTTDNGYTYEWQASHDSINWTDIADAYSTDRDTVTLDNTDTTGSYFRCIVTCGTYGTAVSNPVHVGLDTGLTCAYCLPPDASLIFYCWYGIYVDDLSFAGINYNEPCNGYISDNYIHIDTTAGNANQNTTYPIHINTLGPGNSYYKIIRLFIDFNDNGSFEDAGEEIYNSGQLSQTAATAFNSFYTIPASASLGLHRMRLISQDWYNNSCGGDADIVRDFDITIHPSQPCAGIPNIGATLSSNAQVCAGLYTTLSVQYPPTVSGLDVQWQASPDNISWSNLLNDTSLYQSVSQTTDTWYRCIVSCPGAGADTSTALLITTAPLFNCVCNNPVYSEADSNCVRAAYINKVILSGVTSFTCLTNGCDPVAPYYTNYDTLVADFYQGQPLNLTIVGPALVTPYRVYDVYIDIDGNGSFDDSGESFGGLFNCDSCVMNGSWFSIPTNISYGLHRMRIRAWANNNYIAGNSCSVDEFSGEALDFSINIIPTPPCTGRPDPGNTLAMTATVCPTDWQWLSLQNTTGYSFTGITYQWQSSSNGVNWANVQGEIFPDYYPSGQTADTYYRCNVTCVASGLTGTSVPLLVPMTPFYNCYCSTMAGNPDGEEILSVSVNGATNVSNCDSIAPGIYSILGQYSDFRPIGSLTTLNAGTTVPFTIVEDECDSVPYYANAAAIWIDYNHDGYFDDVTEKVFVENSTHLSPRTINGSINVPATASSGLTGMRVTVAEATFGAGLTSCFADNYGMYGSGETEDYLVTIVGRYDIGVETLSAPLSTSCYSSSESIKVKVKNFGGVALNLAAHSVTVHCAVTGPNPVTFANIVLSTGTIPAGGTVTVTFSTNYNMSANGIYGITAYTTVANDGSTANDSYFNSFIKINPPTVVAIATPSTPLCAGQSVILRGAGASSFSWSNGVVNNVSFAPQVTTTYTLTGTDGSNCSAHDTLTVVVHPVPNVSVNSPAICVGQNANLSAAGAVTYSWSSGATNTGGGTAIAAPTATTSYSVTGTSLGCTSTAVSTVTVNQLPTVTASAAPAGTFCAGNSVTLSGGGASTYSWSGGVNDGSSFTPAVTDTYTVTGTDGNGCENTATQTITVNELPIATATSTAATCNPNGTATVSVTGGTSPYTNLWSTTDTASTISGLTVGSYSVTVTDINGCVGTASTSVTNAPMIAPSICMVTVNDSSSHNIVLWDKTGMTNVMQFNIYREDATNVYSPIGTVPFDSLSRFVDYSPVADPNVTTKRYKISVTDSCGNESALSNYHNTLYIADIGGGQYLWADLYTIENNPNPVIQYWLMRDTISGANNWQQVATTSGTQHVLNDPNYLAYPNADYRVSTLWNITCTPTRSSISTTHSNIKHGGTSQTFTLSPLVTDANCPGDCNGSADAHPTGMQGPVTYLWLPTNDTSRTVTGLCEGVTYTVTATDGTSTSTSMILITATNILPDVTTNVVSLPAITANQVGASYQWLDCGAGNTAITGETNQTFTATAIGDYAVLVSINGCADTSACVQVNSVGIEQMSFEDGISMYPNPAAETVTIESEGNALQSIKVMNVLGEVVYQQEIQNRKAVLDLSSYAKGVYSVEINVQNNKVIKKLVIQ